MLTEALLKYSVKVSDIAVFIATVFGDSAENVILIFTGVGDATIT